MLKAILTTDTGFKSHYTDILNNVRIVKHSIVLNNIHKHELEEQIARELYRIFTHKTN